MTMVYVPAGEFEMGSTEGNADEQPVHTVALDAFWLDQTEVTNAQYQTCVTAGACDPSSYADESNFNAADQPVVGVSWFDVVDYCTWVGGRLPTEAEWEYAARGPEGFVYPWGDSWQPGLANCDEDDCEDGFEYTAPVGSFYQGASWVGALDMVGNVWEWVADWYDADYYARSPRENPTGPEDGAYRVLRGGSWGNSVDASRCGFRGGDDPRTGTTTGAFVASEPLFPFLEPWALSFVLGESPSGGCFLRVAAVSGYRTAGLWSGLSRGRAAACGQGLGADHSPPPATRAG
jgi:serine/threonine-protein kinase